jgi:apolipoprotein N-acyltransferase
MFAMSQEKGVDVDINVKKESAWYENPVVWVIGGAVFILLLVALLRSGERRST